MKCKKEMVKGLVSVIIVNWNGKDYLNGCLTTLFNQTYNYFEVIFVDNASIDGSVEFVRQKFPQVKIIINRRNLGFSRGNIIGLKYSNGEYIFLLNNDTELHPQVLEKLLNAIQTPNIAGACGKIYSLSEKNKCIFTLPKIHPLTGEAIWINDDLPTQKVDYLSGNSMLLKRSIIEKIGFLDKAYFAYFEETDLCARIIRAGYDLLYVSDAIIWHKEMGSSFSYFNKYYMIRNQIRFIIKNFDLKYIPKALFLNFLNLIKMLIKKEERKENKDSHFFSHFNLKCNLKFLVIKAILWNLIFLPHTLYSRIRDFNKIGKFKRSYNESLPLKNFKNDRSWYIF